MKSAYEPTLQNVLNKETVSIASRRNIMKSEMNMFCLGRAAAGQSGNYGLYLQFG